MTTGLDGKRHLSCNPGSNMSGIHKKVPLNRSLIAGVARATGHSTERLVTQRLDSTDDGFASRTRKAKHD